MVLGRDTSGAASLAARVFEVQEQLESSRARQREGEAEQRRSRRRDALAVTSTIASPLAASFTAATSRNARGRRARVYQDDTFDLHYVRRSA